jgi:hypothetical protein
MNRSSIFRRPLTPIAHTPGRCGRLGSRSRLVRASVSAKVILSVWLVACALTTAALASTTWMPLPGRAQIAESSSLVLRTAAVPPNMGGKPTKASPPKHVASAQHSTKGGKEKKRSSSAAPSTKRTAGVTLRQPVRLVSPNE